MTLVRIRATIGHWLGRYPMRTLMLLGQVSTVMACQQTTSLPEGLDYAGPLRATPEIHLLTDDTWIDEHGKRRVQQQIFDAVFAMVQSARRFVLLDMFLFNDFQGQPPEQTRALSSELVEVLLAQRARVPKMPIVVITDPVNTVYGGLPSSQFATLQAHDITVVITDLDLLPDSNPCYSWLWRRLIKPLGNARADTLPNPFGDGRVSVRSWLRLLNFKANHRKVVIADRGDQLVGLVTSANPHDGSSAHRNSAIQFQGPAVLDLWHTEKAVLDFSNAKSAADALNVAINGVSALHRPNQTAAVTTTQGVDSPTISAPYQLQVLTEGAIKFALLKLLASVGNGDQVDLMVFYLSDRELITQLVRARQRGAQIRVLLDPNKDAFGMQKNGIPNRPVAAELTRAGVEVRWCDTHGEQCHSKLALIRPHTGPATLLTGSANLTRRNLDNFNLETDILVSGSGQSPLFRQAAGEFSAYWHNHHGKHFTVPYHQYAAPSPLKYWLYRLQEASGLSTF